MNSCKLTSIPRPDYRKNEEVRFNGYVTTVASRIYDLDKGTWQYKLEAFPTLINQSEIKSIDAPIQVTVINKGGRGKKLPYETTVLRIPKALESLLTVLTDEYRLTGNIPSLKPVQVSETSLTKDDAIALANQLLKSKKGAKPTLEKLLTALYSPPVNLD